MSDAASDTDRTRRSTTPAGAPRATATGAPRPPRASRRGDRCPLVLRGIGQTLITLGLVVLLFVVYEVWVTNIFAHRAQHEVHNALENAVGATASDPLRRCRRIDPATSRSAPASRTSTSRGWAGLRTSPSSRAPSDASLEKGPGHYAGTALPGQIGNFAVAGHRVGKGEPFLNLDHLQPGDTVDRRDRRRTGTSTGARRRDDRQPRRPPTSTACPGREIVDPSQNRVIAAGPRPARAPTADRATLHDDDDLPPEVHREAAHDRARGADADADRCTRTRRRMPAAIPALYNAGGV